LAGPAQILARHGAHVLATDIDAALAGETAKSIVDEGGRAGSLAVDARKDADLPCMMDEAIARHAASTFSIRMPASRSRATLSKSIRRGWTGHGK
jgi:NAD(P)-dependent dehydrogenase (short-subunit alcohol dehydrogenase family)